MRPTITAQLVIKKISGNLFIKFEKKLNYKVNKEKLASGTKNKKAASEKKFSVKRPRSRK